MSENKFIKHLKGKDTAKSVLEIKNQRTTTSFANMPAGTSNANDVYSDNRGNATGVLRGSDNWKLSSLGTLIDASTVYGDGRDFIDSYDVLADSLWVDATYTFATPKIFNPNTKFVLKLCGERLSNTEYTVPFSLIITIGNSIITKSFVIREHAFAFSEEFVIDFAESNTTAVKCAVGDTMRVQLLCGAPNASATLYYGMTVFTALQRRVDGDAVASDTKTFDELEAISDAHISNKNNPHEVTKAQVGLGNCDNTSDLDKPISTATQTALDGKVNDTGDTLTGLYKHQYGSRTRYMAANSTAKYADVLMNSDEFEILFHTSNSIYDGLYGRATNGYVTLYPGTDNQAWLGLGSRRWSRIFVTQLCPDSTHILTVPEETGTLATKGDVDLAANSGRMITDQGVWYAKMDAATTPPVSAEVEGRNYADFSQVDGNNNPIIVIYTYTNGAWNSGTTVVPPADYDGYVPVTSKIWDIPEQAGQQGGRILWNHQSKEFTPYPQIVSFEDIEVTGQSTVIIPNNPVNNQIVNKNYVDEAIAAIPTPTVDIVQSIDAEIVGTLTVASNGDVSGMSSGNRLLIPGLLDMSNASTFEMVFAFTTVSYSGIGSFFNIYPYNDISAFDFASGVSGLRFKTWYNGASPDTLTGTTVLSANTKYYAKVTYDGTNYTIYLSTDGVNWSLEATAIATYVPKAGIYNLGYGMQTFHMAECYIKKNGILIWQGMDTPGLHQRVATGHEVIEFQAPTAQNNYTWYRKYADGWVEQGGITESSGGSTAKNVVFPIEMADTNYTALVTIYSNLPFGSAGNNPGVKDNNTTTGMTIYSGNTGALYWEVKGMAA